MKNFLNQDIQWRWEMNKINPPLAVSSQEEAMKLSGEIFEYPQPAQSYWYDRGDIYFDENEVEAVEAFVRYNIDQDSNYPDRMAAKIYAIAKRIDAQKINAEKITSLTLEETLVLYKQERKDFITMMACLAERGPVPIANTLRKRIESLVYYRAAERGVLSEVRGYIDTLSAALFPSVFFEEKKNALEQAVGFTKLSEAEKDGRIDTHLALFGWMSFHWGIGVSHSKTELYQQYTAQAKTVEEELRKLLDEERVGKEEISALTTQLAFQEKDEKLLAQYREWLYLRTFVKDKINLSAYRMLPILEHIASFKKITAQDIAYLTVDEIFTITNLDTQEIEDKIRERKSGFSAGIIEGVFQCGPFLHKDKERTQAAQAGEVIRGTTAFRGKVTGIVHIMHGPKDQAGFQRGEILVVGMTTPDYLPSMQHASAFITDEGGITCHAAIVSRELKKPCIIGTKIATQVLHDGDLVEVDANEGVVRIIERASDVDQTRC